MPWKKLLQCLWLATAIVAGVFATGQSALVVFTFADVDAGLLGVTEVVVGFSTKLTCLLLGVSLFGWLLEHLINSSEERKGEG